LPGGKRYNGINAGPTLDPNSVITPTIFSQVASNASKLYGFKHSAEPMRRLMNIRPIFC